MQKEDEEKEMTRPAERPYCNEQEAPYRFGTPSLETCCFIVISARLLLFSLLGDV